MGAEVVVFIVVVVPVVVVVVPVVVVVVLVVAVCDVLSCLSTRSCMIEEVNVWVIGWSRSKVVLCFIPFGCCALSSMSRQ